MTDSDVLFRAVVVVLIVLVSIPFVMLLVAMPFTGGMHTGTWDGGMWSGGMGVGAWVWMALFPLVILLVIGYGSYRLLGGASARGDDAIGELRVAYARGELTDEEYETRRQRLEADRDEYD